MKTVSESSPAEVYDQLFVPALFAQWGAVMATAADVRLGDRVLDVACGTGALTLAVAKVVGPHGSSVGLDPNPEMLAVAKRKHSQIEWVEGKAEALPMANASFDAVVSQFGLMFFRDRVVALREMMRVLRPGKRLAVAVCDAVENSAGYAAFARLLDDLFGPTVGASFCAPFALGDSERLLEIADEAGVLNAQVMRRVGQVRFESINAMISAERACVWTLGGVLHNDQFALLLGEAGKALRSFVTADGSIMFDIPVLILTAEKA